MRLSGSVYSKILDMDTGLTIVTPNKLREGKYKVVYLLHGLCGNDPMHFLADCYQVLFK